jgi:hypothetical protein
MANGRLREAREQLETALRLYRETEMQQWREQAEAELGVL